jgi:hypothetical protein
VSIEKSGKYKYIREVYPEGSPYRTDICEQVYFRLDRATQTYEYYHNGYWDDPKPYSNFKWKEEYEKYDWYNEWITEADLVLELI